MLLVIDVGNTNIVAGVFDDKELVCHWRFSTDRSKTADEYGILLRSMFNYTRMPMDQIKAIIISSVVPPLIVPLCHMCERYFELTPMVVGPGIKSGISLRYDNPREVYILRPAADRRIFRRRYRPWYRYFYGGFVPENGKTAAYRAYQT